MTITLTILFAFAFSSVIYLLVKLQRSYNNNKHLDKVINNLDRIIEDQKRTLSQIVNQQDKQQILLDQTLKAERQRIAHELHDDIIQRLVVVRLRMEQLQYFQLPKRADDEVNLLHTEMESIMTDIRYLINDVLQPKFEVQSFSQLMRMLAEKFGRILHRTVDFELLDEQKEFYIPPDVKKELFFIVQEASQNSLKHSVALLLKISISWANGLRILILDDGQGLLFRGQGIGYGSDSIKQRAAAIGAKLDIHSSTRGLMVIVELDNVFSQQPVTHSE